MPVNFDKYWEKSLKEWEECVEKVENHLKELLTQELDEENNANITNTVRLQLFKEKSE